MSRARKTASGYWLVDEYDLVRNALIETQFVNDLSFSKSYSDYVASRGGRSSEALQLERRWLSLLDGERHAKLRQFIDRAFAAQLTPRLSNFIDDKIASRVSALLGTGPTDAMADVAHPVAIEVICEVFGIPDSDRPAFLHWAPVRSEAVTQTQDQKSINEQNRAAREFGDYFHELLRFKRKRPENDLLSSLAVATEKADGPSQEDLHALCLQLLSAGHLPMAGLLGTGLAALAMHSSSLSPLVNAEAARAATEEIVRFSGTVRLVPKVTVRDTAVLGATIPQGEIVMLALGRANRDPAAFADADVFRPGRRPNNHLGFGLGPHFCLGARLARMEMRSLCTALAHKADLRDSGETEIQWLDSGALQIPRKVMVNLREQASGKR